MDFVITECFRGGLLTVLLVLMGLLVFCFVLFLFVCFLLSNQTTFKHKLKKIKKYIPIVNKL